MHFGPLQKISVRNHRLEFGARDEMVMNALLLAGAQASRRERDRRSRPTIAPERPGHERRLARARRGRNDDQITFHIANRGQRIIFHLPYYIFHLSLLKIQNSSNDK